jgi:hypothetical protein
MTEIDDLLDLADAASDTQLSASAVWHLRGELSKLGCRVDVDWAGVVDAQCTVEREYLRIYEGILEQARSFVR